MTAKEIQFDSNGECEYSYRPFESVEATVIENELLIEYPHAFNPTYGVPELIGVHGKDDINYSERTITVVYKGGPPLEIIEEYDIFDISNFCDCYCQKYLMDTLRIVVKAYDADLWQHRIPSLPRGSRICQQFGIGIQYGSDKLNLNRDLYFFHDDRNEVQNFFDKRFEVGEFDVGRRGLFGLLYDARSLKVIKLKQYVFPDDLKLQNLRAI